MAAKKGNLIAYNDLESKIINSGFCTFCGACEAACPVHAIKIEGYKVEHSDCSKHIDSCPICYEICPHSDELVSESLKFVSDSPTKREGLGYYRRILLAQAADPELRKLGHGGAIVTTLLTNAIDTGMIDSAIVSQAETNIPIKPKALVGVVPDDVFSAVGSKFFPSSVARAYGSAVYEYGKGDIAFVGVPCHVLALRKLEAWEHKITGNLKVIIGLFCFWTLSFGHLLDYLSKTYNINPDEIKRLDIVKELIVQTDKGTITVPLSEVKPHILTSCETCTDFTSELADISVGSAYPLKEWSTVIIRTKAGEDFFYSAVEAGVINTGVIELEPDAFAHVIETAVNKRKTALKELNEMKEAYVPVPVKPLQEISILSKFKVKDVMSKKLKTVSPDFTVSQLLDFMAKHHHTGYPVVDESGDFMGLVALEDVVKVEKEKRDEVLIRDIIQKNPVVIFPEELALDAFKKMRVHDAVRIAVVDNANPKKIIGMLTKTDLRHILSD
ncbi:MAG: Coenzyme F420 hydrogenase/dehydrogenase, beta subunit C-terminal domain [Candidatus Bathyarchaeota archaeon]|nr:Coenzyme F420 hydrogenase/dehydrogenase, beta subunit C-terminal domain [Candidatus Bathyarchaeum sp.]